MVAGWRDSLIWGITGDRHGAGSRRILVERNEAVLIIRKLAESLRSQPNQFNIKIDATATGVKNTVSGGIGMVNSVTGGGSGSSTTGLKISMSTADVKIASDAGSAAISREVSSLVDTLNELAMQLEAEKPDTGLIEKIIGSFKDTWVPPLITTVVSTVVGLFLP